MKAKDWLIIATIVVVLILLWLFLSEREKAKRKDDIIDRLTKENETLKSAYLDLLMKYLKEEGGTPPNVINELKRLKDEIDHLDTEVHVELDSVIKRVSEGEGTKAVKDLAKIVETKLKEKAANDATFKKKPMLHNLLEHARDCSWISSRQYENGLKLKEIRNRESHELAVTEESREIGMTIYAGIDLIYALK